jgi:hypothetical protein
MSKQVSSILFLFLFRLIEGIDTVPMDYAHRVCNSFAQLGVYSYHMPFLNCCRPNDYFFQVYAELQCYSVRGTVVSEMVAPTPRCRRASQMTARTILGSWPSSLRVAHCKSVMPVVLCVALRRSRSTFFSGRERMQRHSRWWDDPGT